MPNPKRKCKECGDEFELEYPTDPNAVCPACEQEIAEVEDEENETPQTQTPT